MKESNATQDPSMSLKPTFTHIRVNNEVVLGTTFCRSRDPHKIVRDIDEYILQGELSSQLKDNLTEAKAVHDPHNGNIHFTVGFETSDAFQTPRGPRALKHASQIVNAVNNAAVEYDSMKRVERLQRRKGGVDAGTTMPYSPLETQAYHETDEAVQEQIDMLFAEADLISISLRNYFH